VTLVRLRRRRYAPGDAETHPAAHDRLEAIRAALGEALASWGKSGETMLETGQLFVPGEPTRIFIRKRGRSYDLDDRGRATELAGKPSGGSRWPSASWPRRGST